MKKNKPAKNIRIYVAQKDINGAKQKDATFCPVARAVLRKLKLKKSNVWVAGQEVLIGKNVYSLSMDAWRKIKNYDDYSFFRPQHIRLTLKG